ncbi:MAG TPA: hypothetical protein DDY91_07635 [Planctomycetaceae bacterium]|nr:hypothetical protein [Planctomycetaceae bacterium]
MAMNSPIRRVVIVDDDVTTVERLVTAFGRQAPGDLEYLVENHAPADDTWTRLESGTIHVLCFALDTGISPLKVEDRIDRLAAFHRLISPGTLIVVYSCFQDIDKISTTVRAMKAGAFLVLEKVAGFENEVVKLCHAELQSRQTIGGLDIEDWFDTELPKLVRHYGGQAVALSGTRVVESARSVADLRKKLAERTPREDVTVFLVPDQVLAP